MHALSLPVHKMRVESAVVLVRHAPLLPCSEGIGLEGAQARGAVQHRERAELLGRRRSDFTLAPPPHSAALANVSILQFGRRIPRNALTVWSIRSRPDSDLGW
jgi:hypothetical protein